MSASHPNKAASKPTRLEDIVELKAPTPAEKVRSNVGTLSTTLILPPDSNMTYQNEKVTRLKLIKQGFNSHFSAYFQFRIFNVELTTEQANKKNKRLLNVTAQTQNIINLQSWVQEFQPNRIDAFTLFGKGRLACWDNKCDVNETYNTLDHSSLMIYENIHSRLADIIVNETSDKRPVKLFVYGTGTGDDARRILNRLSLEKTSSSAVGFDFNASNIKEANKLARIYKENLKQGDFYPDAQDKDAKFPDEYYMPCEFFQGDTVDLLELHNQQKNNPIFSKLTHKPKTVIAFSGSATRCVLEGTKEALYIFQQAYHCAELIVSGGAHCTLLSPSMAKRCGFKLTMQSDNVIEDESYFILKQIDRTERRNWLKKQINKNPNIIDLSMSADPIQDLKLLNELETEEKLNLSKVALINLSFTFIPDNKMAELKKELLPYTIRPIVIKDNPESKQAASDAKTASQTQTRPTRMLYEKLAPKLKDLKNVTFECVPPLAGAGNELNVFSDNFVKRHNII